MANRRCFQSLTRFLQSIKTPISLSHTLAPSSTHAVNQTLTAKPNYHIFVNDFNVHPYSSPITHIFCSKHSDSCEDDDCDGESAGEDDPVGNQSAVLSAEDNEKEAAEMRYEVISPLRKSDWLSNVMSLYSLLFRLDRINLR